MSELILWKKQELDKLRKDMDLLFRRFRKGVGQLPGHCSKPLNHFQPNFRKAKICLF